MSSLIINIQSHNKKEVFEIKDYVHDENHRCKFEVFKEGEFVASFEPGRHGHLYVCKNTGKIDNEVLHSITAKLESYNL